MDKQTKPYTPLFPGQKTGKIRVFIKRENTETVVQERFALFEGDTGFRIEV